jgi:hypothetical protein
LAGKYAPHGKNVAAVHERGNTGKLTDEIAWDILCADSRTGKGDGGRRKQQSSGQRRIALLIDRIV